MIYSAKSADSWNACKPVMQEFLESRCEFLFIPENESISLEQFNVFSPHLPELDLIQFCTLKPYQRGELGIREMHWILSDFIAGNKSIFQLLQFLHKSEIAPISKLFFRYSSIRNRRSAVQVISREFADFGIVIPHYIEPRNSTVFLSRAFVKALLEINVNNELSTFRAIFALARTANFSCIRISGFKR
jgi:hypothetical protein